MRAAPNNPIKTAFAVFLDISPDFNAFSFDSSSLSLYQRCVVSGLGIPNMDVSPNDLERLLGQASRIDSTPQPWVADIFSVMALKWFIDEQPDRSMDARYQKWLEGFLPTQLSSGRLSPYEEDVAEYILNSKTENYRTCTVPLFLHYTHNIPIHDHNRKQELISGFMKEFRGQMKGQTHDLTSSLLIYVFDNIGKDVALVPPNGWSLDDLITFLEKISVGLRRWTWEEKPRTKNSDAVKWLVQNEYHVQNLLYILLGPVFTDITDEIYIESLGQKTPRIDLFLPSIHTVIEVKYKKDRKKSFSSFIGEIAEDASLYRSDPKYKDANIVCFLWDNTRSTQEHTKFKEGVSKIEGIDACVIISSPSQIIT